MSGGSFEYVCFDVEWEEKVLICGEKLDRVEKFLRENDKHDAADEVLKFKRDIETHKRRILALGKRIAPILHDAEWWCSGDYGEDQFDKGWQKFLFGT